MVLEYVDPGKGWQRKAQKRISGVGSIFALKSFASLVSSKIYPDLYW